MKKANSKLDPAEWDFSGVPEEELHAGVLWEYARESAWIRAVREQWLDSERERRGGGKMSEKYPELSSDLLLVLLHSRTVFDCITGGGSKGYNLSSSLATPWQKLPLNQRNEWAKILGAPKSEPENAPFARVLFGEDCFMPERGGGVETDAFRINWRGFTNREIVESFRQWVKANRPADVPEPGRKGDKTADRRAWLQWLGAMRALKSCSFAHSLFPEKLKRLGAAEVYRMRREARRKFKELFHYLPETEPISFNTGR